MNELTSLHSKNSEGSKTGFRFGFLFFRSLHSKNSEGSKNSKQDITLK